MDEGLKHVRLLLQYDMPKAADYFFSNTLLKGGDGSLNYHLRKVETALLLNDIDGAKNHIAAALHLNATDAIQTFDRRLLTVVVGKLLVKRGDTVALDVLENEDEVSDLLNDERAKEGPIASVVNDLLK